jgi:hypothetical protein
MRILFLLLSLQDCSVSNSTLMVCWTPNLSQTSLSNVNFADGESVGSRGFSCSASLMFDNWQVAISPASLQVFQHPHLTPLTSLQQFSADTNSLLTIQVS